MFHKEKAGKFQNSWGLEGMDEQKIVIVEEEVNKTRTEKQKILIVDDEEVNRVILDNLFQDEYVTLQASNGQEAIEQIKANEDLVLVLLDIVMPQMDGFGVLEYMKSEDMIQHLPVILITSETVRNSEDRAYAYGIADVIHKPFYPDIVKRRANNIVELYQNKHNMEVRLKEQEIEILSQQKKIQDNNEFMIDALSSVVEFRSLETGEHIRRIKYFTRILLKYMEKYFPKYGLTKSQIDAIARASALHDIGKIGILATASTFWRSSAGHRQMNFTVIAMRSAGGTMRDGTGTVIRIILWEIRFPSARRSYPLWTCMTHW